MTYKPSGEIFDSYLDDLIRGNLPDCLIDIRLQAMTKYLMLKQEDLTESGIPCPVLDESVKQLQEMKGGVDPGILRIMQKDLGEALNVAYGEMLSRRIKNEG